VGAGAIQQWIVILFAAAIYLPGLVSPPHLMDDVDAAEALQAKNMLQSGDWVTQHLNGTPYLDKAPLKYWITAGLYAVFGVHDWVARLPTVAAVILLCWLVAQMGGFYSGLVLATSIGLYLFTRTVIPDVILTLFIALSLWCFFRLLESEKASIGWALGMYSCIALAVLTKGLIGMVLPVGIAALYLVALRKAPDWRRFHLIPGVLLLLAIAAPWHIAAVLQNPPIFDVTLQAGDHFGGKFRGFFWFYFVNEQLLRFLNERWPRDYNTVPRLWFWAYHLLWFFPWSLALPVVARLSFKPIDRTSRLHLLAVCWIFGVMLFFTFSTTQEYYSMPMYPAMAILLGLAMSRGGKWMPGAARASAIAFLLAALLIGAILMRVWAMPTPGDIYSALVQHPALYTLSLGHMADLTLPAFAYLRTPLALAGAAFLFGGAAVMRLKLERAYLAIAVTLVLFFYAARLALVVFDPYLSSYAIAQKLNQLPPGTLIVCGKYNPLSSVFFYSTDRGLQNENDLDILEYGSLAPGARKIVVNDEEMKRLWSGDGLTFILAKAPRLQHIESVLGALPAILVLRSGDKFLFANRVIDQQNK
jgi:4-amino-4-deoxy-L-arabinose transferase-like glycosyltransferase